MSVCTAIIFHSESRFALHCEAVQQTCAHLYLYICVESILIPCIYACIICRIHVISITVQNMMQGHWERAESIWEHPSWQKKASDLCRQKGRPALQCTCRQKVWKGIWQHSLTNRPYRRLVMTAALRQLADLSMHHITAAYIWSFVQGTSTKIQFGFWEFWTPSMTQQASNMPV